MTRFGGDYCSLSLLNRNVSEYWDSFYTSKLLREQMMKISERIMNSNQSSLILVDTHCHFDLIFDRLFIRDANVKKYFHDYKDLYPEQFLFEYAIQVFWRPIHFVEKHWRENYSKYLDFDGIYSSCGIHPHWSHLTTSRTFDDLERCLQHPKVIAIGEMGLDLGPKNICHIDQQIRVFEEQLRLAIKWNKPIVIHSRNAHLQTFEILKKNLERNHKIHLHCFVGTIDDARLFTSYFTEIKFGFTPLITRPGTSFIDVIKQLDSTEILAETDSPYFIPEELFQYTRSGHPSMVYSVVETIAYIRNVSIHELAEQLRENARTIYGI